MIVLDTNVLVAALWSRTGASFRIVDMALDGRVAFAISVALALEYEDVLMRPAISEQAWADRAQVQNALSAICASAHQVMPIRTRLRPTLVDPGDELVLECAVQCGADAIVTMNGRHFAPARSIYKIAVITPGEWLEEEKRRLS